MTKLNCNSIHVYIVIFRNLQLRDSVTLYNADLKRLTTHNLNSSRAYLKLFTSHILNSSEFLAQFSYSIFLIPHISYLKLILNPLHFILLIPHNTYLEILTRHILNSPQYLS